MLIATYFISRDMDLKFTWNFYDQYWLKSINLPSANSQPATTEWGPPDL